MLTIQKEGFRTAALRSSVKAAVAQGKKCILLVPEQETLNAESAMARILPPSAPLFFEVSNFSRLANTVFRALGGICYQYASDAASALLMWKTLDALAPFLHNGKAASEAGAVKEMLSTVNELYAMGIGEEDLESAARRLPDGERLKEKLADLALILRAYRGEMRETYGMHAEDLDRLAQLLKETAFFKDTLFFVDAFTSFTAQEYRILDELIRQTDVTVSLTHEGEIPSLCYEEIKDTERQLLLLARGAGKKFLILKESEGPLPPALLHAKAHLFRADKRLIPFEEDSSALALWKARDPFEAADAVAADIAAKIRKGERLRDFVIFVRDIKKYRGILDRALEKQGIHYFMSAEQDVFSFAAVRMIRSAYSILNRDFRRADVLDFLKSGFCPLEADDIDAFEIYTDFWHVNGDAYVSDAPFTMNPSGYTDKLSARDEDILARANRVKDALKAPLCALKDATSDSDTVEKHASALYAFLKAMGCEGRLLSLSKREASAAREAEAEALSRLFGVLCDLLDTAVEAVGDMRISRKSFAEMLDILFSSVSFGQLPISKDAVTVGSADMLRAQSVRYAYLLGVNEGEFPATVTSGGAFADSERKMLEELGLPVAFDPLIRASREQFCFLRALCAPTVQATVISCETDPQGSAVHPSTVFLKLEKMFADARTVTEPEAFTPRAALEGTHSDEKKKALKALLGDNEEYEHYFRAESTPISDTVCKISDEYATSLFGREIRMSQSRFESYASCPFAYYCRHLLRLEESKSAEFGAADIGTLIHAILENLFLAIEKDGSTIKTVKKEELARYVDRICRDYVSRVCPKELLGSPRLEHLFSRLKRTALLLSEELFDEFAQSDFMPSFFELPIGRDGAPDPIAFELSDGSRMIFHGVIDRIDTYRHTDGRLYVRVIDYKTGTKEFSLDDIEKGKNLQMLLYLFSLWKNKNPIFANGEEVLPAGVMYISASPKDIRLSAPSYAADIREKAKDALTRSGLILEDEDIVRAMDHMLSGHFVPLAREKDGSIKWDKHFASLEKMGDLLTQMQKTVSDIGSSMRRGHAHAEPSNDSMGRLGTLCDYCAFKVMCRRK